MTQNFEDVSRTTEIAIGLIRLLARDLTALTAMSGDSDPDNPPEDAISDNRTQGVLKINGDSVIDYKNGFLNSTMLSTRYQALSAVLSNISGATLNTPCFIEPNGTVVHLTDYGVFAANSTTIDGIKGLAKRSNVGLQQIETASVTQEKLEDPIVTDPPFKCGNILFSCKTGNRPGFLKLGAGYTVGSGTSNATYRNDIYFNLYEKLWSAPNAVIRDYSNNIIVKGISASEDFSSGNSVELPNPKPNVQTTLIETTEPGVYNVELNRIGFYELFAVSGGGGSAAFGRGGGSGTVSGEYPAIGGT